MSKAIEAPKEKRDKKRKTGSSTLNKAYTPLCSKTNNMKPPKRVRTPFFS